MRATRRASASARTSCRRALRRAHRRRGRRSRATTSSRSARARALTEGWSPAPGRVTAIEIDRDLAARLREQFTPAHLRLHEADALAFDFRSLGGDMRIVGNLPYNISSPLVSHRRRGRHGARRARHAAEEVVARMTARRPRPTTDGSP
jgi:hypothetical protein